jgi:hypothetical protein
MKWSPTRFDSSLEAEKFDYVRKKIENHAIIKQKGLKVPRDEAAQLEKVTGFGLAWDQGVGNCQLANVNLTYF